MSNHAHTAGRDGTVEAAAPRSAREPVAPVQDATLLRSEGGTALLTHGQALSLQRSAGNHAVSSRLYRPAARAATATLFRDDRTMTSSEDDVNQSSQETTPNSSQDTSSSSQNTSSAEDSSQMSTEQNHSEEPNQSTMAPETKKATPDHPATPKLQMDLASGESVLKNAFGSIKTIVPGSIQILDQAAFQVAYDKIYGTGPYSWDKYVKPTYGNLNGFADTPNKVNYINKDAAGLHTVVHEMLHNNTASDWRGVVGDRWDEGTTEILTQVACKKLNVDAPTCYPGESPCVQAALDAGLPLADLEVAYLSGGAKAKVADWVDKNCKENWAAVKGYMQAKNWAAAKAALAKK